MLAAGFVAAARRISPKSGSDWIGVWPRRRRARRGTRRRAQPGGLGASRRSSAAKGEVGRRRGILGSRRCEKGGKVADGGPYPKATPTVRRGSREATRRRGIRRPRCGSS
jgi:hypothetical protein